jgi:phage terminase small subunit
MTPKRDQFVKEYLVDLNATQAAIRAGYSEKTAKSIGQQLLTKLDVQDEIAKAQSMREKRTEITQDKVLRELARIAFADPRNIFEWGADGVTLKDSTSLSDDDAATVSEVSQVVSESGGSIKAKMYDKQRALELIGKHLGMFVERKELTGADGSPLMVPPITIAFVNKKDEKN